MLTTVAAWLASQGVSLALGFLAHVISDAWATYQNNQAQEEKGRLEAAAEAERKITERAAKAKSTSETVDAMSQDDLDALTDDLGNPAGPVGKG